MKDVNPAMTTTLPLRRPIEHAPSFAAVAEQHLDDVYRYLLVLTRDPTLAEDLAGETFERAFRDLATLRSAPRLGAHLALLDRAQRRARPLPLRVAARAARGGRRRARARRRLA